MGPRKGSKKQPPARGGGAGNELLGSPGDSDAENAEWGQQTEQEKRKVIDFTHLLERFLEVFNLHCFFRDLLVLLKGEEKLEGAVREAVEEQGEICRRR